MFSSALTKILPGRRAGLTLAGTVFAAAGLMLASLVARPTSAATSPRPAPGQVAGVSTTAFAHINVLYDAANHTLILKSSGLPGPV